MATQRHETPPANRGSTIDELFILALVINVTTQRRGAPPANRGSPTDTMALRLSRITTSTMLTVIGRRKIHSFHQNGVAKQQRDYSNVP